jgi:hypothetical protein
MVRHVAAREAIRVRVEWWPAFNTLTFLVPGYKSRKLRTPMWIFLTLRSAALVLRRTARRAGSPAYFPSASGGRLDRDLNERPALTIQ